MTQRRTYTQEQKAEALLRVATGEEAATVARDMDIEPATLRSWINRDSLSVATVATSPHARTRDDDLNVRLKHDLSDLLHAKMQALILQAEYYGSEAWLTGQPPERVLESTRTLWRNIASALDRLAGREEPEAGD